MATTLLPDLTEGTALLISDKLETLGLTMPAAAAPIANFKATTRVGDMLYVAGQVCLVDGEPVHCGKLGEEVSIEDGVAAARLAGLGVIAQIAGATTGRVEDVRQIVRLGVFVASTPGFDGQPFVANGASDLMVDVFGEAGRHVRTAVGVAALPRGVSVEIDAIVQLAT